MRHGLLFLLLLWHGLAAVGQGRTVQVGLLVDHAVKQATVYAVDKPLVVEADGKVVAMVPVGEHVRVQWGTHGVSVRNAKGSWSAKRSVLLRGTAFRLKATVGGGLDRTYPGSLDLRRMAQELRVVALVPMEEYVAGVVQAEAGWHQHLEYYKMQATSCRTYAMAAQRKHAAEGYELCDRTHCQVFHGRNRHAPIAEAVEATRDLVIVDPQIRFVHATFHSNCGGETMNAEDVWSKSENYLRAAPDPFCTAEPHAEWRHVMPVTDWLAYLRDTFRVDVGNAAMVSAATQYAPPCREVFLRDLEPPVRLTKVRADLRLRSTRFTLHQEGDQLVFEGRGFGHAIGLCQEGAMRMAHMGYDHIRILHYYYTEVHLVDLQHLDFFRAEDQ